MFIDGLQFHNRIKRLPSRYPGKSNEDLIAIIRLLDRYLEIALSICLEATGASSRETTL